MDATYLSLFIFTIITILYYLIMKPSLQLEDLYPKDPSVTAEESYTQYTKKSYYWLFFYILLVILSQFFINVGIIVNKCGGGLNQNFAAGAMMTFIPWVFIFGSVALILIVFPGFKSAFSNVIGYFAVSGEANSILNELLVNTNLQQAVDAIDDTDPAAKTKKNELQKSAEAIIKLCGNTSIMINQIVPENFTDYWGILEPLMKPKYQNPAAGTQDANILASLKQQLLKTVITRDNIGEALWYFYTAILLISIVQYNLTTRGCIQDPASMAENHKLFLEQEENQLKQQENSSGQVYAG